MGPFGPARRTHRLRPNLFAGRGLARRYPRLLLAAVTAMALAGTALADPRDTDIVKIDAERLAPGIYPAAPVPEEFAVPAEPGHPPFALDWSIGLKGTYTSTAGEGRFGTTINPQFTATHEGSRADIVIDGSADISRDWIAGGNIEVPSAEIGVSATVPIDSVTTASADARVSLDRQSRFAPDLDPLVEVPPQVLTGSVGAGIERQFGRFNIAASGRASRVLYGPTERADTGLTDNSAQSLWGLDSTLRVGLEATPILGVFGEVSAGRDVFDTTAAGGVRNDATDLALRGGISGSWNGTVTASASIGRGYRNFDDASLGDVATQLYDASITFTPDPTVSLTASFNTSIDPVGADASGTARITHAATAEASYIVNSWLRLRASADWSHSLLTGSGETERRYGVGAGADYKVNSRTALSADYDFGHRDNSTTGALDTHRVSIGVTLRR